VRAIVRRARTRGGWADAELPVAEEAIAVILFAVGGLLGLILLVIWVLTIVDIVRSHLGAAKTSAWILIVILLPFVGSLLYWFVLREPTEDEVQRRIDNERAMRESAQHAPFDSTSIRP
jgi:uncharacterized integral membrane protein